MFSGDAATRDHCDSLTASGANAERGCMLDPDCVWTYLYGIKFEKGRCSEAATNTIGSVLTDKTVAECDKACIMEKECVSFQIGRDRRSNKGKCTLISSTCTKVDDDTYDVWESSPKVNPN